MSVISLNISVSYTSTGSVGPYPFDFSISTAAAMTVYVNNTLVPSTSYIVSKINNNFDNGGSVTFATAPTNGQLVVLQRATPLTQTSEFHDNLPQPMEQFENALDKLTEIVQELAADAGGGGTGNVTYVVAGTGIVVTGTGTQSNPFVVSTVSGFSIVSFTGGQSGELGQSFVTPTFYAAYSGTVTSANISNTSGLDSPHNLAYPYTSATLAATFTSATPNTIIFTLTASNGATTQTATQRFTLQERLFGGVGTSGLATGATASGTNAILIGDTGTLPTIQLGPESVGQPALGWSITAASQHIYLLLTQPGHTFRDLVSGFPFAMNPAIPITFVNQYGVSLSMFMYISINPLVGTFEIQVAS